MLQMLVTILAADRVQLQDTGLLVRCNCNSHYCWSGARATYSILLPGPVQVYKTNVFVDAKNRSDCRSAATATCEDMVTCGLQLLQT